MTDLSLYINNLSDDEKNLLYLNLRSLNRSIQYGLDNELSIFFLRLYGEVNSLKSKYDTEVRKIQHKTKIYQIYILLLTLILSLLVLSL
ncbi:hypothetical protein AAJ76_3800029447 [Vairimorpha ceranae]|uniref:Uncharacterized protein n=1 Tax=Vairimorpha ceranae TaxID=40302 RepID=A0A0F9WBR0_9MICR|nr:hypothetical protein AAJ76_3800029447 [Vairimorpha ceranae]KAF5140261.1 hypothetical protein G9O61_00g015170 [Vairimorpha ceranae]KKO74951.1 hypothetical protein AAJ76_3800029447 [Vairimorpha ceranae]